MKYQIILPCRCTKWPNFNKGTRLVICYHGYEYLITAKPKTIIEYEIEDKSRQGVLFNGSKSEQS